MSRLFLQAQVAIQDALGKAKKPCTSEELASLAGLSADLAVQVLGKLESIGSVESMQEGSQIKWSLSVRSTCIEGPKAGGTPATAEVAADTTGGLMNKASQDVRDALSTRPQGATRAELIQLLGPGAERRIDNIIYGGLIGGWLRAVGGKPGRNGVFRGRTYLLVRRSAGSQLDPFRSCDLPSEGLIIPSTVHQVDSLQLSVKTTLVMEIGNGLQLELTPAAARQIRDFVNQHIPTGGAA